MATIGNKLNLMDVARRTDRDGNITKIVEVMAQTNDIIDDIPWIECNDGSAHETTQRNGLPDVYWRKYNQFIPDSKSTTAQITDTTGMLEAYSKVDAKLLKKNGNSAAWLLSEETPFIESLTQTTCETMFYGDVSVSPEKFMGLAPRYSVLDAPNGVNIIDMKGTKNLTSIWLVVWGENSVCGLYPKGTKAGIDSTDKGVSTVYDGNGKMMEAHVTHFTQDSGLCVRDWRQVVRIANIDCTALLTAGDSSDISANIEKALIMARSLIQNENAGRLVCYSNKLVRAMLEVKLYQKGNIKYEYEEIIKGYPRRQPTFLGMPIKRVDRLGTNETQVKNAAETGNTYQVNIDIDKDEKDVKSNKQGGK